jgi:uncharacterized protein (TIGR03000 family)
MSKYFMIPAFLSCAGLLVCADAAHAQRGGGGRGGSAHGGTSHGGAYHGGYYRPGIGLGIGVYSPLYGYGYGYSPYAYDPFLAPRLSYYPPALVGVLQNQQPQQPMEPAGPAATNANIRVVLPYAQAKVWFDGTLTSQGGTDRLYHTPTLDPNGKYSYRIRAAWTQDGKEMIQEQVVPVSLGQTAVVNFTRPPSEAIPAPK